jgi:hypothetical protein
MYCSKIVCCLMQNSILCCLQEYVHYRYILSMDKYIQCMNKELTTCFVLFQDIHHTYSLLLSTALFIMCMYRYKTVQKNFMMLGIEQCTSCTLQGCSDRCTASVNTLVCYLYLRWYKSSNLLKRVHLVAGDKRLAQALRRLPLQPCRRRALPPLGFGGSLAWL